MIINSLPMAVGASITTFAATNMDDLVLLIFLSGFRVPRRKIVAGQYLGFGLILVLATMAAMAAWNLPHHLIRFLGILPIAIGMKHLLQSRRRDDPVHSWGKSRTRSIALLIFSNGADNIAVYIPLFVVARVYLPVIWLMYAVLLAGWSLVAIWLGQHPFILRQVLRRGHWLMPAVLIALGVYILHS
jgi:cadmium resistance protein CadD (predicted permease)